MSVTVGVAVKSSPVDVIAIQDGMGVGHSTLADVGSWFQAICAGIHAGRAASQCWANSETFKGNGGASNIPAPVSRVIQQLQAEQAYVDRFTDYTYEQLDTPLVGSTTEYNDWLNYVSTQPQQHTEAKGACFGSEEGAPTPHQDQ